MTYSLTQRLQTLSLTGSYTNLMLFSSRESLCAGSEAASAEILTEREVTVGGERVDGTVTGHVKCNWSNRMQTPGQMPCNELFDSTYFM